MQWNDYNFFGDGRQASVLVRYASINSHASASLRQPYFFDNRELEASDNRGCCQEENEQTFTLHSESRDARSSPSISPSSSPALSAIA